jgi:putative membrane protein
MKTLILCVDRDDDIGVKAHLKGPFIGREENLNAASSLALSDPEDPDANTMFSAIALYDELIKSGMDVQIATIAGSPNVGFESDEILSAQLDTVIEQVRPDRAVLVSNGAEDEYFFPIISSRIKIDSVKRVFVKQTPTVEGIYYNFVKTLSDKKTRKKILMPLSVILILYSIFLLIPPIDKLSMTGNVDFLADIPPGLIPFVIGIYLIWYAYDASERIRAASSRLWLALRSGSQMLPFAFVTGIMVVLGLLYSISTVAAARNVQVGILALVFLSSFLWIGVFAALVLEVGRFTSAYLTSREFSWSSIIAGLMFLAIGLLTQGALDSVKLIYHLPSASGAFIAVEIVAGILTAMFAGLLNMNLHTEIKGSEQETEKPASEMRAPK